MKKILATLLLCCMTPILAWAEPMSPADCPNKVLERKSETGTLKGYYLSEYADEESTVTATINGKDVSFTVPDNNLITKKLKGKEGQRFIFTYERMHSWLGDGCYVHEVLHNVKRAK